MYFEKDESSFWGIGIPSIMRDPQQLFNSAIRMMVDNAAITSGPQIEVNNDLLEEEEDVENIVPFRIWTRSGTGADAVAPAMRVYQIESHTAEFIEMARLFMEFGDEATALPKFTYNEPDAGAAQTVGGLSMLMGQANITLKDIAKNWDDGITTPFITDLYHFNMQFSDDTSVKGDMEIIARGASSLVAKEIRSHALDAFAASTLNPVDLPWIKTGELLRQRARARDLPVDDIVKTDDEFEKDQESGGLPPQAQQQMSAMQQQIQELTQQLQEASLKLQAAQALVKVERASKQDMAQATVEKARIEAGAQIVVEEMKHQSEALIAGQQDDTNNAMAIHNLLDLIEAMNSPRRVVRGPDGKPMGLEPMVQPPADPSERTPEGLAKRINRLHKSASKPMQIQRKGGRIVGVQ
jgi:DNA-binding protein YbaB